MPIYDGCKHSGILRTLLSKKRNEPRQYNQSEAGGQYMSLGNSTNNIASPSSVIGQDTLDTVPPALYISLNSKKPAALAMGTRICRRAIPLQGHWLSYSAPLPPLVTGALPRSPLRTSAS